MCRDVLHAVPAAGGATLADIGRTCRRGGTFHMTPNGTVIIWTTTMHLNVNLNDGLTNN